MKTLRERVDELRQALEEIVVPMGCDSGLLLKDTESPTKLDGDGCIVYLHEHFSEMGGALVALHQSMSELLLDLDRGDYRVND